ncbi:macrophage colony-stimulating factor 1 isoform X2 [Castor canadensis]|uniref:Macrophage colony-stimulating factor 1 isoform X2 n=1 Tax=Castor canadensis TaxID=51338 RepID=A0AC58KPQ5_CASCN
MPREPARLKGCAEGWPAKLRQGKVKVCLGPLRAATAVLSASRDSGAALDRGSDSAAASEQASEPASAADAPGRDPAARMTARGAAGRCPPTTWLGPWLLLVCLLVSRSIAEEVSEHCSHMIGKGHLQFLQQLIDSQMETSCQIAFEFVDQEQLEDPVCYLKKAFPLVQDIMEDTMRFKDNTPNANAIVRLQELSLRLKSCFTKDYEEHDKACIRTFYETPLQLLEKIKNVFNETKNLLEKDWNIFSKSCNNSFAKCSSQGHARQHSRSSDPQLSGFVFHLLVPSIILVLLAVGGLLFYRWRRRIHGEAQTLDSPMGQPEGSPLTQDEDRQVELPV